MGVFFWGISSSIMAPSQLIPVGPPHFPDGSVVKHPPTSAEDMGLIPDWGTKIPHAAEQLSHTPQLLSPLPHLETVQRN